MKKIMFNDKYGLTQAVLERRKTQTRRLLTLTLHEGDLHGDLKEVCPDKVFRCVNRWMFEYKRKVYDIPTQNYPKYIVGEIVAVAQSYHTIYDEFGLETMDMIVAKLKYSKGWSDKRFVAPNLMPHQIRITNVRIERLQDISREDCLAEGVEFDGNARQFYCGFNKSTNSKIWLGSTPREAYSTLIDRVSGKGTWHSNPFVFVYDFELVK